MVEFSRNRGEFEGDCRKSGVWVTGQRLLTGGWLAGFKRNEAVSLTFKLFLMLTTIEGEPNAHHCLATRSAHYRHLAADAVRRILRCFELRHSRRCESARLCVNVPDLPPSGKQALNLRARKPVVN